MFAQHAFAQKREYSLQHATSADWSARAMSAFFDLQLLACIAVPNARVEGGGGNLRLPG